MTDNEFIVTTGKMTFKEVKGSNRLQPFKPGLTIKIFLGFKIDYVGWNGVYRYRVWKNDNECHFHTSLEESEQSIIRGLLREI